jgi:hypothetical protein
MNNSLKKRNEVKANKQLENIFQKETLQSIAGLFYR